MCPKILILQKASKILTEAKVNGYEDKIVKEFDD